MHKPHITPLSTTFIRAINKGVEYFFGRCHTQFEGNQIIVVPISGARLADNNINILLDKFRTTFAKYKNKRLKLSFESSPEIDQNTLRKLGQLIAENFPNLQELDLDFFNCRSITAEGLKLIFRSINRVSKNLRKLRIGLRQCGNIGDKALDSIKSFLLGINMSLEALTIDLSAITYFGEIVYPFESNVAKRMHTFATCEFYDAQGRGTKVTSRGLASLKRSLSQGFHRLKKLIWVCPGPIYEESKERILVFPFYKNLANLQVLYLKFDHYTSNPSDVSKMAACIGKYLKELQYLTIDLLFGLEKGYSYSDLKELVSNIFPNLPKLRGITLYIDLLSPKITNEELLSFGTYLVQHAKSLEELILHIDFVGGVSQEATANFTHYISYNLPSLQRLTLKFPSLTLERSAEARDSVDKLQQHQKHQKISQSVKELYLYIDRFNLRLLPVYSGLEKLILVFRTGVFNEESLEEITEGLFSLDVSKIQELALYFDITESITDDMMKKFFTRDWSRLVNLRSFTFRMSRCKGITDTTLGYAGECITKNMKNLRALGIGFRDAKSVTEEGLVSLINTITSFLPNLNDLALDYESRLISALDKTAECYKRI